MAQTRLKSGNLHMVGGDNGTSGNVLKSKGDGTFEWGAATTPPSFSSVDYPGDDTALDPAGGQNLVINGGGFLSGINVKVGGTNASSVTVNSVTQITIVTPAKSAGTYALEFTNTDGGNATANSAVSYNGIPAFTNAAGSLGTFKSGVSVSVSAGATEPDGGAITHTVTSGSLPSGLSLNATTGAITGTAPDVAASTTSSFTITATDNENQSTSRAYSIQIDPVLPSDDFNILTYTGNGGTQTITGLSFQPDFVWLKRRNSDAEQMLNHPNIGIGEYYRPSYASQGRLTRSDVITSLNSNGFSLGGESITNNNNDTYVAYCWKVNGGTTVSNTDGSTNSTVQVNADKGISMITYSGNGSTATVGHGLGKVPHLFFMMDRYNGGGWIMWHKSLNGANKYLEMGTGSESTSSTMWNNTLPTSTVFSLGNNVPPNGSGRAHVCWAFTSIDGHSSFDSYAGNGSSAGPILELGFKPALLIIRRIDSGDNFYMFDSKRETSNPRNTSLRMNSSAAEGDITGDGVIFLSNGFQIITSDGALNFNGGKYIYMAWAQDPDATAPTLADSFNAVTYTGTGSSQAITGLGFAPNLVWVKQRGGTTWHNIQDTINGATKHLYTNASNAQDTTADGLTSFDSDGFTLGGGNGFNGSSQNMVAWAWKADDNEPTIEEATEDADAKAIYTLESNANDVTGNYNATASGITYSSGKFGNAATYSGTNASTGSKIYVSNNIYGSSTSTFTVSLWIKCTNTSGEIPIAGNGGTIGGTQGYAMYLNSGSVALTFRSSNGNQDFYYGSSINDNAWHHLVLTFNNGPYALYLDGELELSGTTTNFLNNTTPSFDTYFGNRWNRNESGVIAGQIDQIRIYDGPLTAASVTALYNESTSQNSTLNIGTKKITSIKSIVSANANAGVSIVKYKGTGSATTIPHGLSAAPEMIIVKNLTSSSAWAVFHTSIGATKYLALNETTAASTATNVWNDTAPNSTTFTVGTWGPVNTSGNEHIAYCFRPISGFSKFGTYNGTGSTQSITGLGFQPDWVMIKRTDGTENWYIQDSARGSTKQVYANLANAEFNETGAITSFDSDGWTMGNYNGINNNGETYIYAAFKIN